MSVNLRIAAKNAVDDARCVLAVSVATTFPVEYVQNYIRGRFVRVPTGAAFTIRGTYGGESVRATVAAMIRHTGEPDGSWRYEGFSDAAWTTRVQDSGVLPLVDSATLGYLDFGIGELGSSLWDPFYGQKIAVAWNNDWDQNDSEIIASWQITIDDTTNTEGVFDLARLWIARYVEFTYAPVYGSKIGWKESSQQWETDGGSLRVDAGPSYRQLQLDMQYFPEVDRLQLMDMTRYCGLRRDMFISVFPDADTGEEKRDFTMNAVLQTMPDLTLSNVSRHSASLNFREA